MDVSRRFFIHVGTCLVLVGGWGSTAHAAGPHPPEINIRATRNAAGQTRYVAVWRQQALAAGKPLPKIYAKIFLSGGALSANNPALGFGAPRPDGEAADAVFGFLSWYGVDALDKAVTWDSVRNEIGLTKPFPESTRPTGFGTNQSAPIATEPSDSPSTDKVTRLLRRNAERYLAAGRQAFKTRTGGGSRDTYDQIWSLLSVGNPVLVIYDLEIPFERYGLIVGLEKVADGNHYALIENDMVLFADGSSMRWGAFRTRWERKRPDFALQTKMPFVKGTSDPYGGGSYRRWYMDADVAGEAVNYGAGGGGGARHGTTTQKMR
jgi:hypothetical protein